MHHILNTSLFLIIFLNSVINAAPVDEKCDSKQKRFLIFDAGSSGTRLYLYIFQTNAEGMPEIAVNKVIGKMTALSRLGSKLDQLDQEMSELLTLAKDSLTPECLSRTWLFLRATAGLRALELSVAQKILDKVRTVFQAFPYIYSGLESAEMMTGQDEGYYLWVFLNFIQERLKTCDQDKITSFDLGGGSTQISTVDKLVIDKPQLKADIVTKSLGSCSFNIYTKSYSEFGAEATRAKFFDANGSGFCVGPGLSINYVFGEVSRTFTGASLEGDRYSKCRDIALNLVKDSITKVYSTTDEPKDLQFVSAYYYSSRTALALEKECSSIASCGIADLYDLKLSDFNRLAKKFCATPVTDATQIKNFLYSEYLCIDLVYLEAMIGDAYGLVNPKTTLTMLNKIKGYDVGWPMGFAFELASSAKSSFNLPNVLLLISSFMLKYFL